MKYERMKEIVKAIEERKEWIETLKYAYEPSEDVFRILLTRSGTNHTLADKFDGDKESFDQIYHAVKIAVEKRIAELEESIRILEETKE